MPSYTDQHARAGIDAKLPKLDVWPNHFPGYRITTTFPEYTSVLPKDRHARLRNDHSGI